MMMMTDDRKVEQLVVANCTECGAETERSLLTVKKVMFTEMGAGAKTDRSVVLAAKCPKCLVLDPEYNLPKAQPIRTRRKVV